MKKLAFFSMLSLLILGQAIAQQLPFQHRNQLTLGAGLNHTSVSDLNASPLTYVGQLPQLSLSYSRHYPKAELQLGLQVAYGSYYSKAYPDRAVWFGETAIPLQSNLAAGRLHLHYLHQVISAGNSTLYVGTGLQQLLQYPTDDPTAGAVALTSVPVLLRFRQQLNQRNLLEAQVQYGLAGLVSRMPWHHTISLPEVTKVLPAFYRNNTRLESGLQLRQFALQVRYRHQLSQRFALSLTYQLDRLQYDQPRPLSVWANSLSAATTFHF